MKILLWHGYLMTGSGSNVYTRNIADAWRRQGHDVVVMCQERHAADIPIVDAEGDLSCDNGDYAPTPTGHPPAPGTCTVLRPDIAGLLPVYVYDEYEGFEVKRFVDLDNDELARYTDLNVTAMETVLKRFQPDVVITGHEVMGPFIAMRACSSTGHRYVAKLHGSALEYAVKMQERYLGYAIEGLGAAHKVVGGSAYMLKEASSVVPGWAHKTAVINPGADVDLFLRPDDKHAGSRVGFVGKLIAEKGVHNFLVALGGTEADISEVLVVGYGGDEVAMNDLASALSRADREAATRIVETLRFPEAARAWLANASGTQLSRFAQLEIRFTGRLEHGPLSKVLPTFDILVVPSIVPEAFGMVAAEAAACGVLPLVPSHSGIAEAGAAVEEGIAAPGLLTFDAVHPVDGIARGIDRILAVPPAERDDMGRAASRLATERWSWQEVGRRLLEAAF